MFDPFFYNNPRNKQSKSVMSATMYTRKQLYLQNNSMDTSKLYDATT